MRYALIVTQGLALAALLARGLWRPHLALGFYLAASIAQTAVLFPLAFGSAAYRESWLNSQPLIYAAQVAMVLQAVDNTLSSLHRLRLTSHFLLLALCAIVAAGVVASLPDHAGQLGILAALNPAIASCLFLFLLGLQAILRGLDRPANRLAVEKLLTLHFGAIALGALATYHLINLPLASGGSILFNAGLAWFLRPAGEHLPPHRPRDDEQLSPRAPGEQVEE